jgi:D-xylose 1-dehydrogenase (NADP+, D-xylono-1,5-lactone-forming)
VNPATTSPRVGSASRSGRTRLRWGVLGAAEIAVDEIIPVLQASDYARVDAIASRGKNVEEVGRRWGITRTYSTYEEVIADDAIDAVYIPLPNTMHYRWTREALETGKHVLCEKPLVTSVDEAVQLQALANQTGRLVAEALMYRHHPQYRRLLRMVHDGELGHIWVVRASVCREAPQSPDIRLDPALGGGALFDVGVYALDAVCMVFDATPIGAHGRGFVGRHGVDELCGAVLEFPDERLGLIDCSFRVPYLQAPLEVAGNVAIARLRNAFHPQHAVSQLTVMTDGRIAHTVEFVPSNAYELMLREFADSVLTGSPFPFPLEHSVRTAHALHLLRRDLTFVSDD